MAVRFFADRSLGDHSVPTALRSAGWLVVSMRERYGSVSAQKLADIDWIHDATNAGEILLTGDKAIAKRPAEAQAVVTAGALIFALGSSSLTAQQKAARFIAHERTIFRRIRNEAGPYVVSVGDHGLETLTLLT